MEASSPAPSPASTNPSGSAPRQPAAARRQPSIRTVVLDRTRSRTRFPRTPELGPGCIFDSSKTEASTAAGGPHPRRGRKSLLSAGLRPLLSAGLRPLLTAGLRPLLSFVRAFVLGPQRVGGPIVPGMWRPAGDKDRGAVRIRLIWNLMDPQSSDPGTFWYCSH